MSLQSIFIFIWRSFAATSLFVIYKQGLSHLLSLLESLHLLLHLYTFGRNNDKIVKFYNLVTIMLTLLTYHITKSYLTFSSSLIILISDNLKIKLRYLFISEFDLTISILKKILKEMTNFYIKMKEWCDVYECTIKNNTWWFFDVFLFL